MKLKTLMITLVILFSANSYADDFEADNQGDQIKTDASNQSEYEEDQDQSYKIYAKGRHFGLSLRLGYNHFVSAGLGARYHFNDALYVKLTFDYTRTEKDTRFFSVNEPLIETIDYFQDSLIFMAHVSGTHGLGSLYLGGGLHTLVLSGYLDIGTLKKMPDLLKRAWGVSGNLEWMFPINDTFSITGFADVGYFIDKPQIAYTNLAAHRNRGVQAVDVTRYESDFDAVVIQVGIAALFMF